MAQHFHLNKILEAGGVSPNDFSKKYVGKNPLFIKGALTNPHSFFSRKDFEVALNQNAPWKWHATKDVSEAYKKKNEPVRGNPDLNNISGRQAKTLREMGLFLVANEPERTNEKIAEFISSINTVVHAYTKKFDTYLFQSASTQGIALHNDPHEIFVLQLEGKKNWVFADKSFPFPVVVAQSDNNNFYITSGYQLGETVQVDMKSFVFKEICMEPGDFLYLPKHCLHKTSAKSDYSLSLNVQRIEENILNIVGDVIKKNDSKIYKKMFSNFQIPKSPRKIKDQICKKVLAVKEYLDSQDNDFFEAFSAVTSLWPDENSYVYGDQSNYSENELSLDSFVQRIPYYLTSSIDKSLKKQVPSIYINGIELTFDEKKWKFLISFLLSAQIYKVRDLLIEGNLEHKDWDELKSKLDTLRGMGLLRVLESLAEFEVEESNRDSCEKKLIA